MRAKNNLCTLLEKVLDSGERAYDSLIGGDNALLHRNVEIATNEDGFTGYVDVFNVFLVISCHFFISLKYFHTKYIIARFKFIVNRFVKKQTIFTDLQQIRP